MFAAVLCLTLLLVPIVTAGTIYTADAPLVMTIRALHAETGKTFPTTDYYLESEQLQRYTFSLLMSVEAEEHRLLEKLAAWEKRRDELIAEQEATDMDGYIEEPGEILQVLVWPPPEGMEEAPDPLEDHLALSPEQDLLAVQELRFRIENVLEGFENRRRSNHILFTEQLVDIQGFLNTPVNSYALRPYFGTVNPFLSIAAGWQVPGGAAAEIGFELRKSREDGLDMSNLPIAEGESRFTVSDDFLQRALLFYPLHGGYILAGRFPFRTGPGRENIGFQSYAIDGIQIGVSAGRVSSRHAFLENTVVHNAELHIDRFRIGIGSQNRFSESGLHERKISEILPVSGAFLSDSEDVITQILTDVSWMFLPRSEVFLQLGMQRPAGGWEQPDYSFAVYAGGEFFFQGSEADTGIHLEFGWTDPEWGGSAGHTAVFSQLKDGELYSNTSPFGPDMFWGKSDIAVLLADRTVEIGFELGVFYDSSEEGEGLSGRTFIRASFLPDDIVSIELKPGLNIQKDGLQPQIGFRFSMQNRLQSQFR